MKFKYKVIDRLWNHDAYAYELENKIPGDYTNSMPKGGKRIGAGKPKTYKTLENTLETLVKTHPLSIIALSHRDNRGVSMVVKGNPSQLSAFVQAFPAMFPPDSPIIRANIRKKTDKLGSWIKL